MLRAIIEVSLLEKIFFDSHLRLFFCSFPAFLLWALVARLSKSHAWPAYIVVAAWANQLSEKMLLSIGR